MVDLSYFIELGATLPTTILSDVDFEHHNLLIDNIFGAKSISQHVNNHILSSR
jgi:hypothetical protein